MPALKLAPSLLIPSFASVLLILSGCGQESSPEAAKSPAAHSPQAASAPQGGPSDEPSQGPTSPTEMFFMELDANGDGLVSLDEVKAPQMERFQETDTDGDGYISADEARAAFAQHVPAEIIEEMQARGMPDPGDTFISNLDTDGDGRVSPEEFIQPAVESFNRMDADGNGMITPEEATAYFDELQNEMRQRFEEMQQQQEQMMPHGQN